VIVIVPDFVARNALSTRDSRSKSPAGVFVDISSGERRSVLSGRSGTLPEIRKKSSRDTIYHVDVERYYVYDAEW
jgi:hypothetical protein